jgi:hypothetical protein
MNKSKKRLMNKSKKRITKKYKKMIGGWNNKRYYNSFGRPPINEYLALDIGKFLIDSELKRYLSNDDSYYNNNQAYKHVEDELTRNLKIQIIKNKFKNEDDYKWLGNQFYYITGNQNPFHVVPGVAGYATWDDGVDFFDWITNTPPRNHPGLAIPLQFSNPLKIKVKMPVRYVNDTSTIPVGIVKDRIEQYNSIYRK